MTAEALPSNWTMTSGDDFRPLDEDVARIADRIRTSGMERAVFTEMMGIQGAISQTVMPNATELTAALKSVELAAESLASVVRALTNSSEAMVALMAKVARMNLGGMDRVRVAQAILSTVDDDPVAVREVDREVEREELRSDLLGMVSNLRSSEVGAILSPTGTPSRSVAQRRRDAGEIIGLPTGSSEQPTYLYPAFQFDQSRHKVIDLVRYANKKLDTKGDPYGALSWWLNETEVLDGISPLGDLEDGKLTEIAIDNIIEYGRRGM